MHLGGQLGLLEEGGDAGVGFQRGGEDAQRAGRGRRGGERGEIERRVDFGAHFAARLLGGFGRQPPPARQPLHALGPNLRALGPDRLDCGHAQLGRFFDHEIEALRAEQRGAEGDARRREGPHRAAGFDLAFDRLAGDAGDAHGVEPRGGRMHDLDDVVAAHAHHAV